MRTLGPTMSGTSCSCMGAGQFLDITRQEMNVGDAVGPCFQEKFLLVDSTLVAARPKRKAERPVDRKQWKGGRPSR